MFVLAEPWFVGTKDCFCLGVLVSAYKLLGKSSQCRFLQDVILRMITLHYLSFRFTSKLPGGEVNVEECSFPNLHWLSRVRTNVPPVRLGQLGGWEIDFMCQQLSANVNRMHSISTPLSPNPQVTVYSATAQFATTLRLRPLVGILRGFRASMSGMA